VTGRKITIDELIEIFFALETCGCHNINLVSPVPYILHIATAIREAKKRGLAISFVYNTNAYENVEALQMLDGLIDIYLPDFKYWNTTIAERLSGVPKGKPYPVFAKKAILEMKRQVGDLVVEDGIAQGGLVVRHLVLPGRLAGSKEIFTWIARNLGTGTFIGLMSQYYPLYEAKKYPILQRKIRQEEYDTLMERLLEKGFKNVFIQELESAALFVPDFEKTEPFKTVRSSGL
jgi:putative pyruvate formate lyase activating enzyme